MLLLFKMSSALLARSAAIGSAARSPAISRATRSPSFSADSWPYHASRRWRLAPKAEPPAVAGQCGVGVVDLGHPLGRNPRGRRIVAGQVRVVRPSQASPGGLDLGRAGALVDAEDQVGIACRHGSSLSAGGRPGAALDRPTGRPSHTSVTTLRRAGILAAITAAPLALAYRFAILYRGRAGHPTPRPPQLTPADLGMPFEEVAVPTTDGLTLPGWFIPADGGRLGPGVALVHGWESARDRLLPMVQFLRAAGFHCLAVDVRGHGANLIEVLRGELREGQEVIVGLAGGPGRSATPQQGAPRLRL